MNDEELDALMDMALHHLDSLLMSASDGGDNTMSDFNSGETVRAALTQLRKERDALDPPPIVCGCHEANCPHTPIAKLPRQELVNHYKLRIRDLEAGRDAAQEQVRHLEHRIRSLTEEKNLALIERDALAKELEHAVEDAEEENAILAALLRQSVDDVMDQWVKGIRGNLDSRYCCDGRECGCGAATVREVYRSVLASTRDTEGRT